MAEHRMQDIRCNNKLSVPPSSFDAIYSPNPDLLSGKSRGEKKERKKKNTTQGGEKSPRNSAEPAGQNTPICNASAPGFDLAFFPPEWEEVESGKVRGASRRFNTSCLMHESLGFIL